MRLEVAAKPVFARHETFHPRFGWFLKGVAAATRAPDAFTQDTATVDLGVGKNMVRSIRFWCRAAKLITEVDNPVAPRRPFIVPTLNAVALFSERDGADPYLELPGSLWLLHWWMLAPPSILPAWWVALNEFNAVEFGADDLAEFVEFTAGQASSWPPPSPSAVQKDVDCFIRMYASRSVGRGLFDDVADSPFRELGLLEAVSGAPGRYRFILGSKPSLPAALVVYACLDFLAETDTSARTISIHRLARDPGSPGRVFRLTEASLIEALERHSATTRRKFLTNAAGASQLVVENDPSMEALAVLRGYFAEHGVPSDLQLGADPANDDVVGQMRVEGVLPRALAGQAGSK